MRQQKYYDKGITARLGGWESLSKEEDPWRKEIQEIELDNYELLVTPRITDRWYWSQRNRITGSRNFRQRRLGKELRNTRYDGRVIPMKMTLGNPQVTSTVQKRYANTNGKGIAESSGRRSGGKGDCQITGLIKASAWEDTKGLYPASEEVFHGYQRISVS